MRVSVIIQNNNNNNNNKSYVAGTFTYTAMEITSGAHENPKCYRVPKLRFISEWLILLRSLEGESHATVNHAKELQIVQPHDLSRYSLYYCTNCILAKTDCRIRTESYSINIALTNSMTYETRRFNAVFTRSIQESLSWVESTQFLVLMSISLRSILILSSYLRLRLPKSLFSVDLRVKILKALLPSSNN